MSVQLIPGRAFDVHGSLPPKSKHNDKTYSTHRHLVVVADSMDEALAMVRAEYPEMKVDNLKHIGERDILVKAAP